MAAGARSGRESGSPGRAADDYQGGRAGQNLPIKFADVALNDLQGTQVASLLSGCLFGSDWRPLNQYQLSSWVVALR